MKPTSFENAIRLQFDTLMKKVIDGIIKNYEKELDRRSNREIPFCELPKIVVNSFPVFDDYELDITIFDVYTIAISSYSSYSLFIFSNFSTISFINDDSIKSSSK